MLHDRTHGPQSALASKDPLPAFRFPLWSLLYRSMFLAALFALELIVISAWLDTSALDGRGGLIGAVGDFGPYILQAIVLFATVLLALGYAGAKNAFLLISDQLVGVPPAWHFLIAHFATMSAFAFLSSLLFGGTPLVGTLLVLAWLATGICGIATGVFFCIPSKILRKLIVSSGNAWLYATGAAVITPLIVIASHRLWKPATALTFELVRGLVGLFSSSVIADPINKTIGTQKFVVKIAPSCSGLEGVGLMLVFSVIWLWFFRSDYKFPPALLLVPAGVSVIFLLNAVRIAILILIGDAGARSVAIGGFHSQAGWIVFNGVALSLVCVANRVPWLSSRRTPVVLEEAENVPAPYIVPFLAILAAAMIARAASGGLEWLYPLRFIAAAGALLLYRRKYTSMNWSIGWAAPVVGGLVFLLWIGLDRFVGTHSEGGIPAGLAALPAGARATWIIFRVMAAVITVPIAEELAFRGFLLRRLISIDFESVSLQRWSFMAVVFSSLAFGILHGDRWIAGTVAGIFYAGAQKWKGRTGDAVLAHAVTNALLSVWVLYSGQWSLW